MGPSYARHAIRPLLVLLATAVLFAGGCTKSSITSSGSLYDFDERTDPVPVVTISSTGFRPQVSHVDRSVVIRLVNADTVPHRLISAPELGYGECPEMATVSTLAPGESGSIVVNRNGLCPYRDEDRPNNTAFQGMLVIH
jgi:hypothetical protein